MSGCCKDLTRPTSIFTFYYYRISQKVFFQKLSSSRIHYFYIILRNLEGKKVCPFLLLENSRPLSPLGPPGFLSTCLGMDSLSLRHEVRKNAIGKNAAYRCTRSRIATNFKSVKTKITRKTIQSNKAKPNRMMCSSLVYEHCHQKICSLRKG